MPRTGALEKEVDELEAGRLTDAMIAEEVMGLEVISRDWPCGYMPDGCELEAYEPYERFDYETDERYKRSVEDHEAHRDAFMNERHPVYGVRHENGWLQHLVVPFYSTDMGAGWKVMERLLELGLYPDLTSSGKPVIWTCEVDSYTAPDSRMDPWPVAAGDSSAALAICRAALLAIRSAKALGP